MLSNEKSLSQIVERSLNEIYIFSRESLQFVYLNETARRNLGYSAGEFEEMTPLDIKPEYSIDSFNELLAPLTAEVAATKEIVIETRHRRKNGSSYAVEIHLQLGSYDDALVYVAIALDISNRKQNEAEMLRFRAGIDASPDSIYFTDPDSMTFLYINSSAAKRTGYSQQQLLAMGPVEILNVDVEKLKADYDAAIAAGEDGTIEEVQYMTKGDARPWSELHRRAVRLDDRWVIITMARDITLRKKYESELQQAREQLETKVEERTHQLRLEIEQRIASEQRATTAQEEMRVAKEEAEKASKAKTEFMSSMSHELRTPLNCILGFAQLLELSAEEFDEKQNSHIRHILSSGGQLLNLVSAVLELHTIEEGRLSLQFDVVSVDEVIEDCLNQIQLRAEEKNVRLVDGRNKQETPPCLFSDVTRLKQLLLNLLSNAIKYNEEGGTVTVSYQEVPGNMLRISITDTGAGIPQDRRNKLFTPFERLGRETGPIEGTGVGLSIAKRLVELLGGKIGYETEVGQGSTFWVEIPLSQEQTSASTSTTAASLEQATYPAEGRISKRVLYIEDDPDNQNLMRHILARLSEVEIEMLTAHNAELGIDLARKHRPDVILLDINLPGMNGLEAVQKLKQAQETKAIPVIAISADATPSAIGSAMKCGFEEYITKPINVKEIQQTVSRFLRPLEHP